MKKRILVALSGGVDSSVAAALLQEAGHEVQGAYFRTWMHEETPFGDCSWKEEMESAQAAAQVLSIPFRVVNFVEQYRKWVVTALVQGYQNGVTPNPDILCNRHVKLGAFLQYAQEEGFDAIATGHYCRRIEGHPGHPIELREGRDANKDQSYFLALVRQDALANCVFPLGELDKPSVREKAKALALPNADKKDSQGICFLGKVPIQAFLDQYISPNPGPIETPEGRLLGKHSGLHHYTLGQRKGIGVPSNVDHKAYVVVGKDLERNALIVAFDGPDAPDLYAHTHALAQLNFIAEPPQLGERLQGRPRYRDPRQSLQIEALNLSQGQIRVRFEEAQRALSPGQVLALYRDDQLIGGGVYTRIGCL